MTTPNAYEILDPVTLLKHVEAGLLPVNEGAFPGEMATIHYPWSEMDRMGKVDLVEKAVTAIELGGTLSDAARSSLENCIADVRIEDRRNVRMDENAPDEVRRISEEQSVAFGGLVAQLKQVQRPRPSTSS